MKYAVGKLILNILNRDFSRENKNIDVSVFIFDLMNG